MKVGGKFVELPFLAGVVLQQNKNSQNPPKKLGDTPKNNHPKLGQLFLRGEPNKKKTEKKNGRNGLNGWFTPWVPEERPQGCP